MLLVREGKLRYENSLTEIFADFPAYAQAITIEHLLHHTSGLPDYEELMAPADAGILGEERQISDIGVYELLKAQKVGKFEPGSRWAYSDLGYVM